MKTLTDCRLYTFVDTAYLHGRAVADVARQLCDGGSDIIQLRAKQSTRGEVRAMAEAILPVTRAAGVPLVVNDHLDVANAVAAEFCHLGQEDLLSTGHRLMSEIRSPNSRLRIGLSTHAPKQCVRALEAGADYVAVGPVYATDTKPGATPVTLDYVRWATSNVRIPWFAIGGINLDRLEEVLAAGAQRVCVVSAILTARDIAAECRKFKERILRCS